VLNISSTASQSNDIVAHIHWAARQHLENHIYRHCQPAGLVLESLLLKQNMGWKLGMLALIMYIERLFQFSSVWDCGLV
jgi:hypothetical protein